VNAVHEHRVDDFVADLRECVATLGARRGEAGAYGTVE
jgi:hypothetical protein